jgi:hypothetical protein
VSSGAPERLLWFPAIAGRRVSTAPEEQLSTGEAAPADDRHYYGIKDRAMAKDASCGFMPWDGVSKGTLRGCLKSFRSIFPRPRSKHIRLNGETCFWTKLSRTT